MKLLHALTAAALLAAAPAGCIDLAEDEAEIGSINGPFMQGPFMQGPFMQGIETTRTDGFEGTLDASEFFGGLRYKYGPLYSPRILGSELRGKVTPSSSTELTGTALRGVWWESNGHRFVISDVRHPSNNTMASASHSSNTDAWEYHIRYRRTTETQFRDLCMEGPNGDRYATFVPGRWDASRTFIDDSTAVTIGCSAGTIHKCAMVWGYKRWKRLPKKSAKMFGAVMMVSLAPYHSACVRAASASLCPSGYAHTTENTTIDLVDSHGFNIKTKDFGPFNAEYGTSHDANNFKAESWFTANGTVGANYERYMVYTGDSDPDGTTIDIYEPVEGADGELSDVKSCTLNRYEEESQGLSPTEPWHVKVYSDQVLWNPPDLGDIEPTGPLIKLTP